MAHIDSAAFAAAKDVDQLYELLDRAGMGPGWNKPEPSLWPEPRRNFLPCHWSYGVSRPALDAAAKYVSTELAERRNLIMYNPLEGNRYATVRTLIAAYQLVLGRETARSHRHTPNALRLVLDAAPGAYTVVDGKKIPMVPGDVLLTPNWSWHGHSNESDESAFWIDFLDVPTVHFLEPMFFEPHPDRMESPTAIDERSPFRFSFESVSRLLDATPEVAPGKRALELGPPRMKTIELTVERIESNAEIAAGRSTANSIYAVIDGEGRSDVDGEVFTWSRGDVLAVPAWRPCTHRASSRSHLLRVTDAPIMRALNLLRTAP